MSGFSPRFLLCLLLTAPIIIQLPASPAKAQSAQLMKSYNQYMSLYKAGKYRKAIPHAKRALDLGEREFGTQHKTYATMLNNLAALYQAQGRYSEAAAVLYKRSLTIDGKGTGPRSSLDVGTTSQQSCRTFIGCRGATLKPHRCIERSHLPSVKGCWGAIIICVGHHASIILLCCIRRRGATLTPNRSV